MEEAYGRSKKGGKWMERKRDGFELKKIINLSCMTGGMFPSEL